MTIEVRHRAEHQPMPWRNGGGVTYELAAAGGPDFDWRVSIAEVSSDGPFSAFPGVDRVITLLSGRWLDLDVDGVRHRLRPLEPFRFDGGAETSCEIDGPTTDLNVMTRRGRATATVEVRNAAGGLDCPVAGPSTLLVCVAGEVLLRDGATRAALGCHDLATFSGATTVQLSGEGSVAVIRVRLHASA